VRLILHIETATTCCSTALSSGTEILSFKELDNGYTHAENLHTFIKEVMDTADKKMEELEAVAVSKGPGSYTGLRIGSSTAKGIAYALNIPLLSVDTLQVMSVMASRMDHSPHFFCPMIDARRMEVYTALYDHELSLAEETEAFIADESSVQKYRNKNILFFGDGMLKCRPLLETLPGAHFANNIKPSAKYMVELALKKFSNKQFEDTAYFEPFYLKEFLAGKKKAPK